MIDAVMYGMMPSAKTESLSSAPPLNRLTRSYRLPDAPEVDWRQSLHVLEVDERRGNERSEPEDRDDREREEDLLAEVRCAEDPQNRTEHDASWGSDGDWEP